MATQLLAVGTTAASSGDLVVAAGTPVTVALKNTAAPVDSGARVLIQLKDDAGAYSSIGELNAYNLATVIAGPGTYRFTRSAGVACGVFSA
ncbi:MULTISPECIES: hypothetical protein [Mesorhizobium]|uniref:hypothetical protein n=1 Tax=Mesorhizobium TaxID=68287 RepID=UPI0010A9666A|nr:MULTISPECIES: hypothetical protein [Mesorhizobium]